MSHHPATQTPSGMRSLNSSRAGSPFTEKDTYPAASTLLASPRITTVDGNKNPQTQFRNRAAAEMESETLRCDVVKFLDNYFPFVPTTTQTNASLRGLVRAGLLKKLKKKYHWTEKSGFSEPPTISAKNEEDVFDPLTAIVDKIAALGVKGHTQNGFRLVMYPRAKIDSYVYGGNNKTDACLTLFDPDSSEWKRLSMGDIEVWIEFKKHFTDDDVQKNRVQVLGGCNHILNDDASRNYMFAIGFENEAMTLWYFSRSHSVKSTAFNYREDPVLFVKIMVSLLFSTAEQLGRNPNITRVGGQYIYRLPADLPHRPNPLFFLTKKNISQSRPARFTGRSTLVWLVVQVISETNRETVPGTSLKILKDIWLGETALTEGQIQQKLFGAITEFASPSGGDWRDRPMVKNLSIKEKAKLAKLLENEYFKSLFLLVLHEYRGPSSKEISAACWQGREIFVNAKMRKWSPKPYPLLDRGDDTNKASVAQDSDDEECFSRVRSRELQAKTRVFTVFDDVCTPLHNLKWLGDVVGVTHQLLQALHLMSLAGWVHRDISTGNVLAYRKSVNDPWSLKLADLEYAKEYFALGGSCDPKSGGPLFLPVEIHKNSETMVIDITDLAKDASPTNGVIIVHNFRHDLESVWWMLSWTAFMRVSGYRDSRFHARSIFTEDPQPTTQRVTAWKKGFQDDALRSLHPKIQKSFGEFLKKYQEHLQTHTNLMLTGSKDDLLASFAATGSLIREIFDDLCMSQSQWQSLELKVRDTKIEEEQRKEEEAKERQRQRQREKERKQQEKCGGEAVEVGDDNSLNNLGRKRPRKVLDDDGGEIAAQGSSLMQVGRVTRSGSRVALVNAKKARMG